MVGTGERIVDTIRQDDIVALTRDLIAYPTVAGADHEREAMHRIGDLLHGAGLDVTYQEVEPRRPNLIARLRGRRPGHLVFNGHIDVVPSGRWGWTHDPYGADLSDGRIYGRGAADMKGGVAALTVAMVALARGGFEPEVDVVLALTVGEETGLVGARHLARTGALQGSAYLVVAEPSEMEVHIAQRGALVWRITVRGRGAHSSRPEQGVNAISGAAHLALELERNPFDEFRDPILGTPSLCVTEISGGIARNVVPDECALTLSVRPVRGLSRERAEARLRHLVDQVLERTGLAARVSLDFVAGRGASCDATPGTPFVRAIVNAVRSHTPRAPQLGGCTAGTDGRILGPALGVPVAILGPGGFAQAHGPDEFVEVAQLVEAARTYVGIAERLAIGSRDTASCRRRSCCSLSD